MKNRTATPTKNGAANRRAQADENWPPHTVIHDRDIKMQEAIESMAINGARADDGEFTFQLNVTMPLRFWYMLGEAAAKMDCDLDEAISTFLSDVDNRGTDGEGILYYFNELKWKAEEAAKEGAQ